MPEIEQFAVGDWVVVVDPDFFKSSSLQLDTKFLVWKVQDPKDYVPGPRCDWWNYQDENLMGRRKPTRILKDECGKAAIGLTCNCKELQDICFPHQYVSIDVSKDRRQDGEPIGYGVSGRILKKTTPPG